MLLKSGTPWWQNNILMRTWPILLYSAQAGETSDFMGALEHLCIFL